MKTTIPVCDYCIEAIEDEYFSDADMAEIEDVAHSMGDMLPDHLCSTVEDNIKCSCLCKK